MAEYNNSLISSKVFLTKNITFYPLLNAPTPNM